MVHPSNYPFIRGEYNISPLLPPGGKYQLGWNRDIRRGAGIPFPCNGSLGTHTHTDQQTSQTERLGGEGMEGGKKEEKTGRQSSRKGIKNVRECALCSQKRRWLTGRGRKQEDRVAGKVKNGNGWAACRKEGRTQDGRAAEEFYKRKEWATGKLRRKWSRRLKGEHHPIRDVHFERYPIRDLLI